MRGDGKNEAVQAGMQALKRRHHKWKQIAWHVESFDRRERRRDARKQRRTEVLAIRLGRIKRHSGEHSAPRDAAAMKIYVRLVVQGQVLEARSEPPKYGQDRAGRLVCEAAVVKLERSV